MEMLAWTLVAVLILLLLFFLHSLREKKCHPELLAERNPNPILCINGHFQVVYANSSSKRFLKKLGFTSNSFQHLLPDRYPKLLAELATSRQGAASWKYRANEKMLEAEVYHFSDIDTFHIYIRDETQKRLAEDELVHQAYHDPLTSLPNQRMLHEDLHQMVIREQKSKDFAMITLAISHLDQLEEGMAAGDINNLIMQIARRLNGALERAQLSNHQTQLYRTENYRFVIIVDEIKDQNIPHSLIMELQSCFVSPFAIARHQHHITCGIGITFYPDDATGVEELIRNANSAANQALKPGDNSFSYYSPEMNILAMEQLSLENDLRNALSNEEFLLYYQPIVHMENRRVVGAEVLLRWDHPVTGMIPPGKFIALAEDMGLIIPITDWILNQVCHQLAQWQEEGLELVPLAINISTQHFAHDHLSTSVQNAIYSSGIDPALIELEITERITILNVEKTIESMNQLKELGISLAVDDFGTGYSSLSYLQQLPLDTLKIDQTFVSRLRVDDNSSDIVKAIIGLAHNLGLKLVAEGVETDDQYELLHKLGCEMGQGYLFGHPVSDEEFAKILELEALDKKGS